MKPAREHATNNRQTYFVTSETAGRHMFFSNERWAKLFLEVLLHYRPNGYLLHEFVIMPEHFHATITPKASLEKAVQFIKGGWHSAERDALEKFGNQVSWHSMGEGFTWETQDLARDMAAAERAWAKAQELMADPSFALVILDELNIALRYDHLPLDKVVAALKARRPDLHVVVTGRNAKPALIDAADLVTDMTLVKHHFAAGVKAQEGIEF